MATSGCPGTVKAAAIIWIVNGALSLLYALIVLLSSGIAVNAFGLILSALIVIVGFVFVRVGWQTLKGVSGSLVANSIGSILIGILPVGAALLISAAGMSPSTAVVLGGAPLVIAGVLGLVGRNEYSVWRDAQKGP